MRKSLLPLLLVPLLAGCGLVAGFIPPIDVGDPLGVDGRSVTTTFAAASGAALSPQAVSSAEDTFTRSFDDIEFDLRGFSLKSLDAGVGLDSAVVLSTPDPLAAFPDRFTLTRVSAHARVSDEANGEAVMTVERDVGLEFVLDEGSCGATSCSYAYAGDEEDLAAALDIEVPSSDRATLEAFVRIIRLDGAASRNEGSFTVAVEADSEPSLAGFSATFTLRSHGTSVRLGG